MKDSNKEAFTASTNRTKSIETIHATKSGHPGESLHPATPLARRKRWSSARLIALISLGAIAVIVHLLRNVPAAKLEGLGAGLCAIAFGGFLVRQLVRGMEAEDELEEEQRNASPATVSPSESNLARQEMNPTTPPPEAGQNIK